jgi:FtsP/CotA-like multicopper oxidase with cupredoxin domain
MSSRAAPLLAAGSVLLVFLVAGVVLFARSQGGGGRAVTLNVSVTNGSTMSPAHLSVRQGDTVTINVTSDRAGEVHLHGYDVHFDATPGQVVSHSFKASTGGDFEIEWESTSTHLGDLAVNP